MARCNLDFTLISFNISIFFLLASNLISTNSAQLVSNPLQDAVCLNPLINCGQGTCKASNASLLGFDCECYSGWSKIQIGLLSFPSCVIPNCTVDFQCGNGTSPPPPPPPLNSSSPCAIVWCGDGNCMSNGTGYTCECYEDSANLFNVTTLACFKECYLGADCNKLGLGPPAVQAPPTSGSTGPGSNEVPNCSRNLQALTMIVSAAAFLAWF